jgi:hypothetical protein
MTARRVIGYPQCKWEGVRKCRSSLIVDTECSRHLPEYTTTQIAFGWAWSLTVRTEVFSCRGHGGRHVVAPTSGLRVPTGGHIRCPGTSALIRSLFTQTPVGSRRLASRGDAWCARTAIPVVRGRRYRAGPAAPGSGSSTRGSPARGCTATGLRRAGRLSLPGGTPDPAGAQIPTPVPAHLGPAAGCSGVGHMRWVSSRGRTMLGITPMGLPVVAPACQSILETAQSSPRSGVPANRSEAL